jgi:hypothetical protein
MKRRIPRLTSDEEAKAFIDSGLSDLDFSQFKSGRLVLRERTASLLSDAEAALTTVEEALPNAPRSAVARDGAIFRLVYTFAVLSQACQRLLAEREGIKAGSQTATIRAARRFDWLSDEDAEAAMAVGRDRELAFQYRSGIHDEIAGRLPFHAAVLRRWLDALKERAASDT